MGSDFDPQHISRALSELIALRGYARRRASVQLQDVWAEAAGAAIAGSTRAQLINRGVLQVAVANAALLSELAGFHRSSLLKCLQKQHPELRIKDLKFRLDSDMTRGERRP